MMYLLSKSWLTEEYKDLNRFVHEPFAWRLQLAPRLYKLSCSYALNTEKQEVVVNVNVEKLKNCSAVDAVHEA